MTEFSSNFLILDKHKPKGTKSFLMKNLQNLNSMAFYDSDRKPLELLGNLQENMEDHNWHY